MREEKVKNEKVIKQENLRNIRKIEHNKIYKKSNRNKESRKRKNKKI